MKKRILTTILLMSSKGFTQDSELFPIDMQPTAYLKVACRAESLGNTYEIYDSYSTGTFQNACVRIISDDGGAEKVTAHSTMGWSGVQYNFNHDGTRNGFFFRYGEVYPATIQLNHGTDFVPTVCESVYPSLQVVSSEVCP
jgi:hypothetical protein